jgi:hypothetical protein
VPWHCKSLPAQPARLLTISPSAQRYFGLPPDVVGASLGEIGVQEVAGLESKIPDSFALGIQSCLDKCGIQRGSQPTAQRQPRVSANALPSGYSSPPPPPAADLGVSSQLSDDDDNNSKEKITPTVIGLIVGIAVLGLGLLLIGVSWCVKRGKGSKYVKTGEAFAPTGHGYGESDAFTAEQMSYKTPYDDARATTSHSAL